MNNKTIVKELKDSIEYRSKHKEKIEKFRRAIVQYFIDKYDIRVRVLFFVTHFAIEVNPYMYDMRKSRDVEEWRRHMDFKFSLDVLADFCKEFECEFESIVCDGERYTFTFDDVDTSNAFIIG